MYRELKSQHDRVQEDELELNIPNHKKYQQNEAIIEYEDVFWV